MIAWPSITSLLVVLLPTVAAAAILWAVPPLLARRTGWTPSVQRTFVSLFRGAPLSLVLAVAILEVDRLFWKANPGLFPWVLDPSSVAVIVELVVVWTIVTMTALAVRRHVVGEHLASSRNLQYGIYAAGLLGVVFVVLSSSLVPHVHASVWSIIGFGTGLVITYLAVHIVNLVANRYFAALARRQAGLETVYRFLRRVLVLVIVLLGVAISTYANFPNAAVAVTELVLAAGFLSIVVGLAAQSTFSNLIAGAMVSISQPFKIGDAVVFPYPNGDWCFVEDIRLNFTVLRTWDLRRLMVPNAMFQSNVLVNYTAVDPTMLVIVYLVVAYEANVDRAREIMLEEARNHRDFLPLGNLPITHVMDYQGGANRGAGMYGGVDLRLLSAAKDQPTAFQVEKDLLYSIRKRFEEEGIALAYPTQRVIVDSPGGRTSGRPPRKAAGDP